MVNGIDEWAITKMDVLDDFDTIKIAVAYEADGKRIENMPADTRTFARCTPIYEEHPGWKSDTTGVTSFADLPANAQAYLERLEEVTGAKVGIVSVGPRRAQTFNRS